MSYINFLLVHNIITYLFFHGYITLQPSKLKIIIIFFNNSNIITNVYNHPIPFTHNNEIFLFYIVIHWVK